MSIIIPKFKRDENGNRLNANGLTMEECDAILEYKAQKESGKATQSTNKGYENSGKTRDDYDASVRGSNKKEAESVSSSAYLPLPGTEEKKETVKLPAIEPDRSSLDGNTIEIEKTERQPYYSLPTFDYTEEEKKTSEAVSAMSKKLKQNETLSSAVEKMVKSKLSAYEEAQNRLNINISEIKTLEAQYNESPSIEIAERYNELIDKHNSILSEIEEISASYDKYVSDYKDILNQSNTDIAEYNAQYKKLSSYTEKASAEYERWKATIRKSEVIKPEADALDKAITEIYDKMKYAEQRKNLLYAGVRRQGDYERVKGELAELDTQIAAYEKELSALKGKRDLTYEELSYSEDIERAEYYASYTEREDFAQNSAYVNTKGKGKPHDYRAPDAASMTIEETLNTVYGDVKYDYINGDDEAKAHVLSFGTPDPFEEYGYMKDEEIAIYNYIYRTEGKESAEAFLSDLMKDLTYRQMTKETGDYKAYADKHPVLGSLLSILTNTMKPFAAVGQLGDYLLDGEIDPNASYNRASYLTSSLREGASKDMNAVGKFLYDTGMSIADFATVTALTGCSGASLAIMGMSSAADTTIEAKDRGLSDGQAIVLGAASGLIEAATEKIGLEKLMNIIAGGGKGVKGALKSILKQTLAEGGEEILSAVGNDVVDVLISLDKSKWETEIDALMEEDPSLTRNKAWGKVFGSHMVEYGLSGLGGALSGAVTGSAGVGINALIGGFKKLDTLKIEKHEIKTPEETKTEKNDTKYPEPYEIIKDAKNAPAYSDYYKYADMVEKSDKLTSENILRLEELWEKRQHTPEAISEIKELAAEGKTLDEVEKSVREKYDDETITYAEIEDAYNAASENISVESIEHEAPNYENNAENTATTEANSSDVADKEYISLEDFANSASAVWNNVDYGDDTTKSNIMQEVHDSMVSSGSVVQVSDSTLQNVGESYPDLRGLKKKERAPLLKEAMSKLKNNLRQFLNSFKNQSFDFEVNGKVLEAKLYSTGINEVLEKITQEKANMLYTTEGIFKNARYLYSTTDYDGDPNVYRWNYFYTPVQIGEDIVGVRIAVRDIAEGQEHLPESQIYNWNIKKDTSLGGVQPVVSDSSHDASSDVSADTSLDGVGRGTNNRISHGVSSNVSDNIISQNTDLDNTFSKNNNEKAEKGNEKAENNNKNDLDESEENEVTRRNAEIEDERSWREPSDPARDRFSADEADFIRDLKAKGEYENHPIRKARTETARSGYVYGASESDIALAERLSKALGRDILFFSEEARNDDIKNGVWDRDIIWINVKHDPEKTVPWIIAHELAHTIEGTKAYGKLKKYVRSELGETEFKKQCDDLLDMYSKSEVEFEVVSNYVADHLLTDEAAIMKLVRGNRTLGEKLLSILDKILEKIGIYGKRTEERLALERMRRIYLDALAEQANAAQSREGTDYVGEGQNKKTADVDSLSGDEYIAELDDLLDRGEISETEYDELYDEYVNRKSADKMPTKKYSLSPNARKDVRRALYDKNYQGEVKLTDSSPSILISQKGVKNLPMLMNASHLRENIFTEAEAKKRGFRVSSDINYHGLGTDLFLKVIDGLDNVTEAYRGTAKAEKSERRENYFLLVSQYTDEDGNIINVPIYINEKGLYNRVFIDTNKISTVFGRSEFRNYISEQIKKGNLVKIKNRSIQTSESTSPINADYSKNASANSISHSKPNVNTSGKNNFPFSDDAKKSMSKKDIEAFAESARYLYEDATKDLKGKALENIERCERDFVRKVGEIMKLPADFKRGTLHDVAKGIIAEQIKGGAVSSEIARELFEMMYDQGIVVDDDFYNQYKSLKKALRTTAVTLSGGYENDFGDWRAFKNAAKGKLKIVKEGGLGVDSYYQELSEEYPELFPEDIVTVPEQLMRMLKVAEEIKPTKKGLDEYFGETSESLKDWLWNDFNSAITELTQQINFGKKYIEALGQRMAQEGIVVPDAESLFETYKNLKKLRRNAARAVANNALTPVEENYVKDLLTGRITIEQIPAEHYNVKAIQAVFEAKQPYEHAMQVIKAYHNHRKSEQYIRADDILEGFEDWKAPKVGLKLSMNTMERNIYSMVKDEAKAEEIIKEYFAPIHKHEAQSTRYKNKFLDKIRALNISGKVMKGNRDSEASAVQFVGEAESHIMRLENNKRLKKSGGLTLEEWQKALSDFKIRNPELDYDRIASCVKVFREIYDQLISDMNRARMLNGYEPIEYRYAYFPHFHRDIPTTKWGKFAEWLGVPQETATLPATIAGMTENFKPGIRWLSAAQERRMTDTEYDCLEGFDRYIGGAADVIFHTENIQKLRSFANRIRYQASDDVIRARIIAIEENTELSDEEKHKRISEIAESRFTLSAFVNELDEYTNLLAGKKLRADRLSEQDMGRAFYNWSKWLKSRFGANMIAGNIGSAMTNFIPIAQAAGITRHQMLKAMYQQIKSGFADDGFADRSDFLTNRIIGTDKLKKTASDKISDALGTPMELIDGFSSGTIVRALYNQAKHDGLSDAEAMERANTRAAEIMADRSKGAMPTVFSRANFFTAIFTQFQLEVANQYGYMMKDIPRYYSGDKRKWLKVIGALFKMFVLSYLFNDLYEALVGRRAAFDPIDIVNDAIGDATGYKLPNMVDAIEDLIDGESFGDLFKTDKKGTAAAVKGVTTNAIEEIPFVGGIIGGGRIPISSAFPDVGKLCDTFTKDVSGKKKLKTLAGELDTLFYIIPPYGGGQLRKMLDDIPSIVQGGSYTYDNAGNRQLQYPTQTGGTVSDVFEAGRSLVFGKNSSRYAREWVESGFDALSVSETRAYEDILDMGYSKDVSFGAIKDYEKAKGSLARKVDKIDALLSIGAEENINYVIYKRLIAADSEASKLDGRLEEFEDHGLGFNDYLDVISTDSYFFKGDTKPANFFSMIDGGASLEDAIAAVCGDGMSEVSETQSEIMTAITKAGMSPEDAQNIVDSFDDLPPTNGRAKAGQYQKAELATQKIKEPSKQLDVIKAVMSEKQYKIMKLAYETYNIEPRLFIEIYIAAENLSYETTGKADVCESELETVISGLDLNDGKKAQLYQFISENSVAKNPFSFEHANFVKEDMDALFA